MELLNTFFRTPIVDILRTV